MTKTLLLPAAAAAILAATVFVLRPPPPDPSAACRPAWHPDVYCPPGYCGPAAQARGACR